MNYMKGHESKSNKCNSQGLMRVVLWNSVSLERTHDSYTCGK